MLANLLVAGISNAVYASVVGFFNANVSLFFSLFFWGTAREILWSLYFPWNLFGPVTSAILSVSVVTFFYRIWIFIEGYINTNITIPVGLIYVLIFIIVLLSGYARLAVRGMISEKYKDYKWEEWRKDRIEIHRKLKTRKNKKKVEWDDVGEEFKYVLYNLGDTINRALERHKKEEKGKRRKRG
jgi:hypothetical protein